VLRGRKEKQGLLPLSITLFVDGYGEEIVVHLIFVTSTRTSWM